MLDAGDCILGHRRLQRDCWTCWMLEMIVSWVTGDCRETDACWDWRV